MNEGFLGTAAPRYADLVLLLEIAMGLALLAGALLARSQRFRAHAWCQSIVVLVNLVAIAVMMIPSFHTRVLSNIPARLDKAYYLLATAHAALGGAAENRCVIHPARSRHQRPARKIPDHQIQDVDAKRPRALVDRAAAGNSDIRALVRAGFVSKIDLFPVVGRVKGTRIHEDK